MTTDKIIRQLTTETARDVKTHVVKKEVSIRSGAAFVSAVSASETDSRTCYRRGEKGHISLDCTNRPKPGWKPKEAYTNRLVRGARQDSRQESSSVVSHFAFAETID